MSLHDVTGLRPFLMGLEKQYMCFKFEILNPFRGYTLNSNISIKEGGSRILMGSLIYFSPGSCLFLSPLNSILFHRYVVVPEKRVLLDAISD